MDIETKDIEKLKQKCQIRIRGFAYSTTLLDVVFIMRAITIYDGHTNLKKYFKKVLDNYDPEICKKYFPEE